MARSKPTPKATKTSGDEPSAFEATVAPIARFPWPREQQLEGWKRLRVLVNEAVGDYTVRRSPDALMLAALLNDVLHECTPDNWPALFIERVAGPIGRLNAERSREATRQAAATREAETRARVDAAWNELLSVHRGSPAAGKIATKLGLSAPTVRTHLVALGHRKATGKRK